MFTYAGGAVAQLSSSMHSLHKESVPLLIAYSPASSLAASYSRLTLTLRLG